ncbi:uncharacterized protein with ParB-like and HNH nuclease domain [Bacillus sp. SORGH_AS 510]|uniref:DUF262 domain-containing protein n=1 Tax=Bacillus sp. SORGH_AS_0510 TaxID=3041771 RepID=UPI002784B84C|nr:DUF262 domain-containing HNH endonuclease family protein [Bacillus sp. SORGH_AS_0510]MDQ1146063.1 uncharacterized protein with ParB-like and HNH nuclease domain [Bacillus sp. SORGH_AS_0510]
MSELLKASEKDLKTYLLIKNDKLYIPYTQRPYEWTKPQVKRLFNDLISVYEDQTEQRIHILNFFTIYNEDGKKFIYDGQQRTVTLILIIKSITEKISSFGKNELANKIISDYIYNESWEEDQKQYKLRFDNSNTDRFFREFLESGNYNDDDKSRDNTKHIIENYTYISELLQEYIDNNNLQSEDLKNVVKAVTNRVQLVLLETPSEDVATDMFETLNNTGKKIADFYVLKNSCIKHLGEENTKTYWNEIEANLDGIDKSDFLNTVVTLINGKTLKAQSLQKIEDYGYLSSASSVENFLNKLKVASKYYLEIKKPELKNYSDKNSLKKYKKISEDLHLFKSKQHIPIILSLFMKNYQLDEINQVLKIILGINIRNFFISQRKANTVEKTFADLSKKIYEEKIHLEELKQELNKIKINDKEVETALSNREFSSKNDERNIKFILRSVYEYENNLETLISNDHQKVNLEHILPVKIAANSQWMRLYPNEDERKRLTANIGNMTIILGNINSSASNKDFVDKKDLYINSTIVQNKKIAAMTQWTKEEIEERQKLLGAKITEIW